MGRIDPSKLTFDTILLRKSGSSYNPMTVAAFLELAVDERISLIMAKKIRFFADEVEVPTYEAIKSIDVATA